MKVYSWNMLYKNPRLDLAFSFISSLDFDVLALQEVPNEFLEQLKTLPYNLAYSVDSEREMKGGEINVHYVVVLSRFPIRDTQIFTYPKEWHGRAQALHTKFVAGILQWQPCLNKTVVRADIEMSEGRMIRVVSAHLSIAFSQAAKRHREFDALMGWVGNEHPVIFCGDFNVLEVPHVTSLNWLSGGPLGDWFLWWRERMEFERRFRAYHLKNPFRDSITHLISLSQLDHILIPQAAKLISKKVIWPSYGSDHQPIFAEFNL